MSTDSLGRPLRPANDIAVQRRTVERAKRVTPFVRCNGGLAGGLAIRPEKSPEVVPCRRCRWRSAANRANRSVQGGTKERTHVICETQEEVDARIAKSVLTCSQDVARNEHVEIVEPSVITQNRP